MCDPRAREQLPPQITPAYLRKLLNVFQVITALPPLLVAGSSVTFDYAASCLVQLVHMYTYACWNGIGQDLYGDATSLSHGMANALHSAHCRGCAAL